MQFNKHPNKEFLKILNCSKGDIWTKFGTLRRGSNFNIVMKIKILNCSNHDPPKTMLVLWARLKNQYMNVSGKSIKVFCSRTVMLQFVIFLCIQES